MLVDWRQFRLKNRQAVQNDDDIRREIFPALQKNNFVGDNVNNIADVIRLCRDFRHN